MAHIILAFASEQTTHKTKTALNAAGITVYYACRSVAETLRCISLLKGGVIVCGFKLTDGTAQEIAAHMPVGFAMLLTATADQCANTMRAGKNIYTVQTPATTHAIAASVHMILQFSRQHHLIPREKTGLEEELIRRAKKALMEQYTIGEDEAHRLLQNRSMESGKKMGQVAEEVLKEI